MQFYDFSPKHPFLVFLCKSLHPHLFYVDKVDNFVYNSILQGFPPFQNVENFCTEICAIHIFRQTLCNVSKIRLFEIRSDPERSLIIEIKLIHLRRHAAEDTAAQRSRRWRRPRRL